VVKSASRERATGRRTNAFIGCRDIEQGEGKYLAYSPDSSHIAMVCQQDDKQAVMEWSRETNERVTLYESEYNLEIHGYSPNGGQILVYGDGAVVIDVTKRQIQRFAGGYSVNSAVFSADGSHIITCEEEEDSIDRNFLSVYNLVTGNRAVIRKYKRDRPGALIAASATRFLLVNDRTIEEWDYASRKILKTLSAHSGLVIDGCEFINCRFTSPELTHTISQYGGMVKTDHKTG